MMDNALPINIHLVCTFICLPCGQHHRAEVGIPFPWTQTLPGHGTFHELLDWIPEIFEQIEEDPCMKWVFRKFVHDHGNHDIRFISTCVPKMSQLVAKRSEHFQKTIELYEQYRTLSLHLQNLLKTRKVSPQTLLLKNEN